MNGKRSISVCWRELVLDLYRVGGRGDESSSFLKKRVWNLDLESRWINARKFWGLSPVGRGPAPVGNLHKICCPRFALLGRGTLEVVPRGYSGFTGTTYGRQRHFWGDGLGLKL